MKQKNHKKTTLKAFADAVKDALLAKAPEKPMYENKKPTRKELETRYSQTAIMSLMFLSI